ncbi:hypothetical protein CALCODRAFT_519493 [Calocera cornea HHB12733]|uniref:F-box domain-containing protein n=1 Tax=Calocera cornea HHB12733 TaxID=1353952 RepID=A0A165E8B2_9BASI|nr:hypothetical protein CALCODRAFT_519493 [Calocera cornea HHB12733]
MTTVSLNEDLFCSVLDEVIGQLNQYRTKELIDFTFRLRLVNMYANQRLEPLTCRFLNIPSHDDLLRILEASVPNSSKHEWINISGDPRHSVVIFDGFLKHYKRSSALKRLVLDLRQLGPRALETPTRFATCPASVKELGILSSFSQTHARVSLFLNSFLWNGSDLKLAFCGIPSYSGLVVPGGHGILALYLDETTEMYDIRLLLKFSAQFREMCLVRLVFSDGILASELRPFKRELLSIAHDKLVFEELSAVSQHPYDRSLDWFSDRVLDGTIWTVPGAPLEPRIVSGIAN